MSILKMLTSTSTTAALLLLTTRLPSTSAQNSTNTTCPISSFEFPPDASVNATGSTSWNWNSEGYADHPWYLSVLLNDTTRGKEPTRQFGGIEMLAYVSVPRSAPNNTQICAYQFGSLNATLEEDASGENSCKGAVSDECVEWLKENMVPKGGDRCPGFNDGSKGGLEEWKKKCPMLAESGTAVNGMFPLPISLYVHASVLPTPQPTNPLPADISFRSVTNQTCAYSSLPSLSLPSNYTTHGLPSAFSPYGNSFNERNTTRAYDLMTRQVLPYVLVASLQVPGTDAKQVLTRFVCAVPDKVVEGSRKVEGAKPWESAAARWRRSGLLWVGVFLAVGFAM